MPTSYENAVDSLYALGHELANTPSEHFNLAYMRAILREMGDPQRRFPSVLIAGTNGKGSTAATLASILCAAGHRTGLYTSPHLLRVNERIRVNGEEIGEEQFGEIHRRVEAVAHRLVEAGELPWHPSFFEVLTAMAFDHFAAAGVEIAVLEVGMGGRLDATNVVEPVVSVITDIALDHQKFLGDTIAQIAREKAGIIRPGGVVVTLPQHPEANDVIGNTIAERAAHAVNAVPYVPPVAPKAKEVPGVAPNGVRTSYPLRVMGEEIIVDSPLVGRHQLRNTALAIATAEELNRVGFAVSARDIERGIRETRWPGRFQRIAGTVDSPEVILDVAHNPAGAWALRSALSEYAGERPLVLVFGVMRDKAVGEIAQILFPLAEHVIATRADNPRSASPEEIQEAAAPTGAEVIIEPTVSAALARASQLVRRDGIIVVTGSIYVVGEALQPGVRSQESGVGSPELARSCFLVNTTSKLKHLLSALRSYLVFVPLIWLWTMFMAIFSLLSSLIDRDGRMQQWFAVTWSKVILKIIGAPLAVRGMEKIDTTRPHLYALNHLSALDIPAVYVGMPCHFRIMAKEEIFRYPFLGWHLRRSGQVSIEREHAIASMRSLNRAAAILKGGQPLVVFPEGGRSATGQLKPFLPGVFYVAIKAGVDVVPMALVGTYELLPMDTFHIKTRPLELLVGDPVSSAGYGPRDMDKLAAKVQKAVEDLYYSRSAVPRPEKAELQAPPINAD